MKLFFVGILIAFVAGCASVAKLNSNASSVQISKELANKSCKALGDVFGKSNADDQEEALVGARNDLKNKTANLGGNFVVLETNNSNPVLGTWKAKGIEILLGGQAYKCP